MDLENVPTSSEPDDQSVDASEPEDELAYSSEPEHQPVDLYVSNNDTRYDAENIVNTLLRYWYLTTLKADKRSESHLERQYPLILTRLQIGHTKSTSW